MIRAALPIAAVVVLAALPAPAQQLPPQAEPRPLEDRVAPPPGIVPPPPAPAVEGPPPVEAPAGAADITFVLTDIEVNGVTVYPEDRIRALYGDRIGERVSVADLFQVARKIETLYRDDGYILSRAVVPAQAVDDGVFRIQVVEGYVSEVILQGNIGPAQDLVRGYLDNITKARPIRITEMERYLLLANDVPGVTALGVLRPAEGEPGAARMVVTLERDAVDGLAHVDNRGSKFAGPVQMVGLLGLNSFTALGERTRFTVFGTGLNDESRFGEVSVGGRFGDEGLTAGAFASLAPAEPGASLEDLDVESEALRLGISGSYPVLRTRRTNLSVSGGFDYADVDVDVLGDDFTEDDLRVLWIGAEADHQDGFGGFSTASVTLRQGLDLFGASEEGDPLLSRPDGEPDFTAVAAQVSRLQNVAGPVNLYGAVSGQYAFDPLLADEEFTLGGSRFGRGYDPSELAGDHGLAATVEVQVAPPWRPPFVDAYQLYAFYDVGAVWDRGEGGERRSLASAGIGVRSRIADWLYVDLEVARPLTREPANDDDPVRYYFSVTGQF